MLSQNRLVWVGGAAASIVVAGAAAGALIWTHPGFLWPSSVATQVEASALEPKAPSLSAAAPVGAPEAPSAAAAEPGNHAAGAVVVAAVPIKPSFDVVNVDPTGEAVIAGRAAPNARVELRDGGKTVAEATADASGQFVVIPPALGPGDHSLSLAADAGKPEPETSAVVAVSVPLTEAKLAPAPAKPAIEAPPAPSPPAPAMRTLATSAPGPSRVAIRSVEADGAGGLIARGSAGPNVTVRLSLNGADVADAHTQSDGRWSLTIKHGMTPGGYVMHADEVGPGGSSVAASADTPFEYPASPARLVAPPAAASPAPGAEQSGAPQSADVIVDLVQTAQVVTGHTLWALSQNYYGDPTRYPVIYEANKSQIHNPNLIYPGQVFVVPKSEPKP